MSETALTVFIPTRLVNVTNVREHWSGRASRARRQRDAVTAAVWTAFQVAGARTKRRWAVAAAPRTPKIVQFLAHVPRGFDTDGLQAALKHVRDGLQDCGLIHADGPDSGHTFRYAQVRDGRIGVTIAVTVA